MLAGIFLDTINVISFQIETWKEGEGKGGGADCIMSASSSPRTMASNFSQGKLNLKHYL